MKSYTDIEQSKKLAEILPLESADMHYSTWTILDGEFIVSSNQGSTIENLQEDYGNQIIPCWSLAALLKILKDYQLFPNGLIVYIDNDSYRSGSDNPIDACYEMILKLHKLKLL